MGKTKYILGITGLLLGISSCQSPLSSTVAGSSAPVSSLPSSPSTALPSSVVSSVSSDSSSVSSSVAPKVTETVAFDGVNALSLAQNAVYSTPVYGSEVAERYAGKTVDDFSPEFVYDNQGGLSLHKTFHYDATHTWHSIDTYHDIGTTEVPNSFLDNILFDHIGAASPIGSQDVTALTYKISWHEGHTIAVSGSTVVANHAVDMSTQIDSIQASDGTSITDWKLIPNNTAYASAEGKTFTIKAAGNGIRINIQVPNPSDTTSYITIGPYFTVNAMSEKVDSMMQDIKKNPFSQNYTAELIKNDDKSVLLRTVHNERYFAVNDLAAETKTGILEKGSAVRFSVSGTDLTVENRRTYPLKENEAGVACPIDAASAYFGDSLKNTWASVASIVIMASAPYYGNDEGMSLLGVPLSEVFPGTEIGNFVGVDYDAETGVYTLSLITKTVTGSATAFTDSGYSIVLSKRGESQDADVEAYLASDKTPSFPSVPEDLIASYRKLSEAKNFTVSTFSYWTENDTVLTEGAALLELINKTSLHSGTFTSYVGLDIVYEEDKAAKTYAAAVSLENRLYVIHGVPNYQTGGVSWTKKEVTEVTKEDGSKTSDSDLWDNPETVPFYTLAAYTAENLTDLNILSVVSDGND